MKVITRLALMVAICIGQFSCTSIYHRTQRHLPPEPTAELRLRLAEAAEAENLAKQAAVKLFDNLQREKPGTMIDTDFDRLEAAAFDLERRASAARDAAERCGKSAEFAGEIERLKRQAQSWLEYVQANRAAHRDTQVQQLQALLLR